MTQGSVPTKPPVARPLTAELQMVCLLAESSPQVECLDQPVHRTRSM
jgi:hypothetical protein